VDEILRRPVTPDLRPTSSRPRRTWQVLGAAAAVIVLGVALAFALPRPTTGIRASNDQTVVHFIGGNGTLAMAYAPGVQGAVFLGSGFADPGPGKVYEIWMIRGNTAVRGGCVRPHDGSIATFVSANLHGDETMAVTVESSACPTQPTTTPFLTAHLTA
jgi:hypothetical protein